MKINRFLHLLLFLIISGCSDIEKIQGISEAVEPKFIEYYQENNEEHIDTVTRNLILGSVGCKFNSSKDICHLSGKEYKLESSSTLHIYYMGILTKKSSCTLAVNSKEISSEIVCSDKRWIKQ